MPDKLQRLIWESLIALALLTGFALGWIASTPKAHAALGVDTNNDGTIDGYVANVICSAAISPCTVSGINWTLAAAAGGGDVTDVGNCATGACFTGAGTASSTLTFTRELSATLKLQDSTTADTAGATFFLTGANANGTANGGDMNISAGNIATAGRGGDVNISAGTGGGGGVARRGGLIQLIPGGGTNITQASNALVTIGPTYTLASGQTVPTWSNIAFNASSVNGVAGGPVEQVTFAANVDIIGGFAGTNITIPENYALLVETNGAGVTAITSTVKIDGANAILFEGLTDNAFETQLAITDPTADRTITLPDATGTIAISATAPITLSAAGAIGLTTPLSVANGGTGLASGTSGGILGYTAAATLASSVALTANGLVIGGGAGATPTSLAAATNGQLPIGSTGVAPVLATLTGVASETDVAVGAGSITIGIVDPLAVTKGGTGTATGSITGTGALTFTSTGATTVALRPGTNSVTAVQLQNAAGTGVLDVDSTNTRVGINNNAPAATLSIGGHEQFSGSAPAVSACGTGPSIVGTDATGKVTTGTAAPTSCLLTFNTSWTNAPACMTNDETAIQTTRAVTTTTTLTIDSSVGMTSHVISYMCQGRE